MIVVNDFWDKRDFWVRFWIAYKIGETLETLRGTEYSLTAAENQSLYELSSTLVCAKVPPVSFIDRIAFPVEFWASLAAHLRAVRFGVEWESTPLFKQNQCPTRRGPPSFLHWVDLYVGPGLRSLELSHILRLARPSMLSYVRGREDLTARLYPRPSSLVALVKRGLDGQPTKSRAPRGPDLNAFDSTPDVLPGEALTRRVYLRHRPAN